MARIERDALMARLAVQNIAIQSIIRALAPVQQGFVLDELRERVGAMFMPGMDVAEDVDAAVAGELAALLQAPNRPG